MQQKLSDKILNHLKHGKTSHGKVGCKVRPTEGEENSAWISIVAKKGFDTRTELIQEVIICYEIEYLELNKDYDEEDDAFDFDLFLVKQELYYNLKDISQLERVLHKWVDDFSLIEPLSNISHPRI
ncbi:MAG: hypothetical protein ACOYXT_12035 [Bacteroidota bacterium]